MLKFAQRTNFKYDSTGFNRILNSNAEAVYNHSHNECVRPIKMIRYVSSAQHWRRRVDAKWSKNANKWESVDLLLQCILSFWSNRFEISRCHRDHN